jgi:hypothetical protein
MTERLLQYIWQFQYLNVANLQTTQCQQIQVFFAGIYNVNQGPDFLNAKIRIAETTWAGSVELHINSSDWKLHNHSNDDNYRNVILHVVWNDDLNHELPFPTLELKSKVSKLLLTKYEELMQNPHFIPCQNHLSSIDKFIILKWKERLLIERLQQKAVYVEKLLIQNKQHWEEVFWWMLARNFGIKINCDAFEKMAQSIPTTVLAKHRNQLLQIEALLMGQAGLLDKNFKEDYPIMLKKEYQFLKKKYQLKPIHQPLYFLRMRPANFPTIRLAQLSMIIHQSNHLFDAIKERTSAASVESLFDATANDYWHYHYVFDEAGIFKKKTAGKEMIQNIMINTVIPILYAYGYFNNREQFKTRSVGWMEEIAAEKNKITKGYELLGIENNSAFDSQSLLHLKKEYRDTKNCLACAIGNSILRENR